MTGVAVRRDFVRRALAAIGLAAVSRIAAPSGAEGHGHHKQRLRRCRRRCKSNRKTCDRGCDILNGDSRDFCKQGCRVALSQCRGGSC